MSSLSADLSPLYSGAFWPTFSSCNAPSPIYQPPIPAAPQPLTPSALQPQAAKLHVFKDNTKQLECLSCEAAVVQISDVPFASGGLCQAFHAWLVGADGKPGPLQVAKKYTFKDPRQGFAEDHLASHMAGALAEPFNALLHAHLPDCPQVKLVPCVRLLELQSDWYSLEEYLEGKWTKFNNIFGDVEAQPSGPDETMQFAVSAAFSHFGFLHTDHEHTVLDVQGVGTTYTDPAIVSRQQLKYGYTDTGYNGLQAFFRKHVCSPVCKALGLRHVDGTRTLPCPTGARPRPLAQGASPEPKPMLQRRYSMPCARGRREGVSRLSLEYTRAKAVLVPFPCSAPPAQPPVGGSPAAASPSNAEPNGHGPADCGGDAPADPQVHPGGDTTGLPCRAELPDAGVAELLVGPQTPAPGNMRTSRMGAQQAQPCNPSSLAAFASPPAAVNAESASDYPVGAQSAVAAAAEGVIKCPKVTSQCPTPSPLPQTKQLTFATIPPSRSASSAAAAIAATPSASVGSAVTPRVTQAATLLNSMTMFRGRLLGPVVSGSGWVQSCSSSFAPLSPRPIPASDPLPRESVVALSSAERLSTISWSLAQPLQSSDCIIQA